MPSNNSNRSITNTPFSPRSISSLTPAATLSLFTTSPALIPSFTMSTTTSKLLKTNLHESANPLDLSLQQSFTLCEPQLKPPFPLTIPTPSQYSDLNLALIFAILTSPSPSPQPHLTHLHSIVTDGYRLFTTTLITLTNQSYPKLLPAAKSRLLWLASELVRVSAIKVDALLIALMRQITAADFSECNLWLCVSLIQILTRNWDCILEEHPSILTSAVFVFLRLLSDHYRLGTNVEELKRAEISFCVRALRQCFALCMRIGRDLVRLLQDVVCIPEIGFVWKDLLFHPDKFNVPGFLDISQLYYTRTPSHYFLLRISPEMETQLRFLLTHVKWGSQKRYQTWFAKKHLCFPCSETVIVDVVRFICCAHHPPNEIIQSDVISRWAVIGWLLKCCKRNYFEANVKVALFYDWLFFDEKVDNIMNIEPALLLMVNSLPEYADMTHMLLEFLFLLVDNYDGQRKELVVKGVSAAFADLVRKGVVKSLDPLTSSTLLALVLRERLVLFLSRSSSTAVSKGLPDACVAGRGSTYREMPCRT